MNTYRVTLPSGTEFVRRGTDIRALITVLVVIECLAEPIKVELIEDTP